MLINYWDCEYSDFNESFVDEEEIRTYGCEHPKNECGGCSINNKYGGKKANCGFLENDS